MPFVRAGSSPCGRFPSPLLLAVVVALTLLAVASAQPADWEEHNASFQIETQSQRSISEIEWVFSKNSHDYFKGYGVYPDGTDTDHLNQLHRPTDNELHHRVDLAQQVRVGARWLEFELHWIEELTSNDQLMVCATSSEVYDSCFGTSTTPSSAKFCELSGVVDFGSDSGCRPDYDRNFRENMEEVKAVLDTDSSLFLIIDLKWEVSSTDGSDSGALTLATTIINQVFTTSSIYTLADKGAGPWPSLSALRLLNKQIMFVCRDPNCAHPFFHSELQEGPSPYTFDEQNVAAYQAARSFPAECTLDSENSTILPTDDFILKWEDNTIRFLEPSHVPTTIDQPEFFYTAYCGLSVGLTDVRDDHAGEFSWSFAPNQPDSDVDYGGSARNCIRMRPQTTSYSLQWESALCTGVHRCACQSVSDPNNWRLSDSSAIAQHFNFATSPCQRECEVFGIGAWQWSMPTNGKEAQGLFEVLDAIPDTVDENLRYAWLSVPSMSASPAATPSDPPYLGRTTSPYITHPDQTPRPTLSLETTFGEERSRFCGLPFDATFQDCKWDNYAKEAAETNMFFVVFAAVGFVISCIFGTIITMCCCNCIFRKKSGLERAIDGEDSDDEYNHRTRNKFRILLAVPTLVIIIGSILLFLGNTKLTTNFAELSTIIGDHRAGIDVLGQRVVGVLALLFENPQLTVTVSAAEAERISTEMQAGLDDLLVNMDDFLSIISNSITVRNILVFTMVLGSVICAILGVLLVFRHSPKWLLFLMILFNFFVFLTIISFIVHASLNQGSEDLCHEIDRPNGIFYLWARLAIEEFIDLQNAALEPINQIVVNGCNEARLLGLLPYQVIGNYQCHFSNFGNDFLLVPVIDSDGAERALSECALQCIDSDLNSAANSFVVFANFLQEFVDVENAFVAYLESYIGETSKDQYRTLVCEGLSESLGMVYSGAALLLLGQLVEMAMLFWLGY